jgi:hypothetical protein
MTSTVTMSDGNPTRSIIVGTGNDVVDSDDDRGRCAMSASRQTDRGYGRRWKKWLLIYLVAAALIYGLIYLILQSGGSSGGGLYG